MTLAEAKLPERAHLLFQTLRSTPGEWLDRDQLAYAIGKRKLSAADVAYLDMFSAFDVIEIRRVETPKRLLKFEYRYI